MFYPLSDSLKAFSFYNEVTIPKGSDVLHSYYMACGFARGYFGIQVNSKTERRVIFSVWDAGNEAVDRNKVAEDNKVQLIAKGEDVFVLSENQSTYIPLGVTHRLENPGKIPLELIEVQSGSYLGEDDIVRFEDKYGR